MRLFPYGDPQPGMVETFREVVSKAEGLLNSIMERGQEDLKTMVLLEHAAAACKAALNPESYDLVYNIDGVAYLWGLGQILQEASFSEKETLLGYWKAAVVDFPMPRRYAPAVAWALSG